jgi:predicted RNA-binding protein with PUA-like domain
MKYWLFKSEPSAWSWADQVAKGDAGEEWDGVRNYQARNFMREMAVGERGFFYHSQDEKAVVGIVEIISEAHQDSTTTQDRWQCVDIKAINELPRPVSLADIKADPFFEDMLLVKSPRLSVQPVAEEYWQKICQMAGYKT